MRRKYHNGSVENARPMKLRQSLAATTLAVSLLGVTAAMAASAEAHLVALRYLVGTWTCTYQGGPQTIVYKTYYAYALGGSWLREHDTFADGGSDEETLTFDPKHAAWTALIIDSPGTTTIFRANGSDARHIHYHSVYPDATMTEAFDRVSSDRYTIHFAQTAGSKVVKSSDSCVKVSSSS